MFSRQSIIRRYTPPTCTLEVFGKSSPLSRWSSQPLVNQLRFRLRFDDPRLPRDQQVSIEGDRQQLEQLTTVVNDYVQQFLEKPWTHLPLMANEAINISSQQVGETGTVLAPSPPIQLEAETPTPIQDEADLTLPEDITLEAAGLLSHQLLFGELATEASDVGIELSALQLFDLANALTELETELQTLPDLNPTVTPLRHRSWTQVAAAMVLAVGVTAAAIQTIRQSQLNSSTTETAIAPTEGFDYDDLSEPQSLNPPDTLPNPKSLPRPKLPPDLAGKPLPTPPSVDEGVPPQRTLSDPLAFPPPINLPPPLPSAPRNELPAPLPTPPAAPPKVARQTPELGDLPQLTPPQVSTRNQQTIPLPSQPAAAPEVPPPIALAEQPEALERAQPNTAQSDSAFSEQELAAARGSRKAGSSVAIAPTPPTSPQKLLDTIPQVAETRQYFEQRWQAPKELKQTLEYRLVFNQDGSLKQIIPLGKAAGIFLDRTGIPPLGATFVSPVTADIEEPTLRLVLGTDNSVRTFLEP